LATQLGCDSYHSEAGTADDKAAILLRWVTGSRSPFLVGTSGLGAGLDYPFVRLVVHVDEPDGLMEFVQESGRGGRDGVATESIVVLRQGWRPQPADRTDGNTAALYEYLDSVGCRRITLDEYMDGLSGAQSCGPREERCDRCESGFSHQPEPRGVPPSVTERTPATPHGSAGPVLLLRQARHRQQEMERYIDGLAALKDCCLLCRVHGLGSWQHSLSGCRQVHKWEFINAKRAVLQITKRQWIKKYDACYRCGQPQSICSPEGSGWACEFGDLVMPGVFGVQQAAEKGDPWLQREFGVSFERGEECLQWAGGSNELGGERCVNGVLVLARLIERWGGGVVEGQWQKTRVE